MQSETAVVVVPPTDASVEIVAEASVAAAAGAAGAAAAEAAAAGARAEAAAAAAAAETVAAAEGAEAAAEGIRDDLQTVLGMLGQDIGEIKAGIANLSGEYATLRAMVAELVAGHGEDEVEEQEVPAERPQDEAPRRRRML